MTDRVQVVTLVASDGRTFTYSGRPQIDPDGPLPVIVNITFHPPRPLPEGCRWETTETKERS